MTRVKRAAIALAVLSVLAVLALFPTRPPALSGPAFSPRPPAIALPTPEGQPSLEGTKDYMAAVMENIDSYWDDVFADSGVLFVPNPDYALIMPGDVYTSNCIDISGYPLVILYTYPNAFYCSADGAVGVIVLPVGSFVKFFSFDVFHRYAPGAGYFSMAVIEAHEYGHYVQAVLNVLYQLPVSPGKNKELLADCFSGAWTNGLEAEGLLNPGDYGEAIAVYSVIGDNVGSHGTNRERVDAYNLGYFDGSPALCIRTYPMPQPVSGGGLCAVPCTVVGTVNRSPNLIKLSR